MFNKCNKMRRGPIKINNPSKKQVGIKYGNRNLTIGSYNVDNLRTTESIDSLLYNLDTNNIDIACIQETHNESIMAKTYNKYTIYYGGCVEIKPNNSNIISRRAGVAIIIKNPLKENIINIERLSERITTITLRTEKLKKTYI